MFHRILTSVGIEGKERLRWEGEVGEGGGEEGERRTGEGTRGGGSGERMGEG